MTLEEFWPDQIVCTATCAVNGVEYGLSTTIPPEHTPDQIKNNLYALRFSLWQEVYGDK